MRKPLWIATIIVTALMGWAMAGCGTAPVPTAPEGPPVTAAAAPSTQTTARAEAEPMMQEEKASIDSSSLKKKMNLNIYLPPGYDKNAQYPVLYLFHGYGGNENSWADDMDLQSTAGKLFGNGKLRPFIIVTPYTANSFGINSSDTLTTRNGEDHGPYEDYILKDVVGYVESHYPVQKNREGRYIAGLSMGGYVALHLGLRYSDIFSRVGGTSPAIWLNAADSTIAASDIAWLYPTGETRKERDPLLLAASRDLTHTKVWLDCGTEDGYGFYEGCEKLYAALQAKGVRAEYHAYPGGHDTGYWSEHLEAMLTYLGTE